MPLNDGHTYREQIDVDAAGRSVLDHLVTRYAHSSRQTWAERLARGEVHLEGVPADGSETLRAGARLTWTRPPWEEPDVPTDYVVLHHDDDLLAVNKPSGLPTLHGGGFLRHTLTHLVRERHPGAVPLHRLGRATSGLVLFALTPHAASSLARDWRTRDVGKHYLALASGVATRDVYEIGVPIGPVHHPRLGTVHAASEHGKPASSVARVAWRDQDRTVFDVEIHTGRPHQIRIHLAAIGHPLVGDGLYAPGGRPRTDDPALPGDSGYLLHAERLVLRHPSTLVTMELVAPPPPELRRP